MQNKGHISRNARDGEEAGAFSPSHTPAITPAFVEKILHIIFPSFFISSSQIVRVSIPWMHVVITFL